MQKATAIYREYPRPIWMMAFATFVDHIGGFLLFPFFALYLTSRFGVSMAEVGVLFAVYSGASMVGSAQKVSGRRPLAIHFVNSISPKQLESARLAAEEDAARQGILSYMGAVIVPLLDASTPPQVSTVPLAELPDRFNHKEIYDMCLLDYANNIGLDPQDLQPLTGQSLGTGAQSAVLDEKAKGKGLASWRMEVTHLVNEYLADELTTFAFIERDYRDQKRSAAISKLRAEVSKIRIDAGITDPSKELQVQVDQDELPKEFLPEDATGETLSDTEKPEKEIAGRVEAQEEETPEEVMPEEQATKQATPGDELQAEIEDTQDESAALFRQARKKE